MKVLGLVVLCLISAPAFAGSHVEGIVGRYTIPASEGTVKAPHVVSAKYGKFVVSEREEGNCDMVSTNGSLDDCHSVATYATKVRVTVAYTSEAGANPTPEASAEDSKEGPVLIHWDFEPSQFGLGQIAMLSGKNGRDLFALTAETARAPISVVDYDHSMYCSPEADSSCENQVAYKTVVAPLTTLNLQLK